MDAIQTIYIALFGRPADPLGLAYWDGVTTGGADLSAIGDLANEAEYQDRFEGMNGQQIITSIYQSLFGRNPEQAGLSYFLEELNSGRQNINTIAINIAQGAKGADADILANKVEAANAFTAAIDTPDEIAAYVGDAAADKGRAFLSTVTADEASIPTPAEVTAAVADLFHVPGDTFNLTTGIDTFVGTVNEDTFNAKVGGGTTINAFDNIDGGAGRDTMKIIGNGGVAINANATIKNIEVVQIETTAAITGLSSASFAGVEEIWQIGNAGAISVGAGVTAGFKDTAVANVTALADATSINVALDNVTAGGTLNFFETKAGSVASVTVDGSVNVAGGLTISTGTMTKVSAIDLGLTSDGVIGITNTVAAIAALKAVDASSSTGDLTLTLGSFNNLETVKGGSGNDSITIDGNNHLSSALSVDAGAGNDIITFNFANTTSDTVYSLTGGEGKDTFLFGSLANIKDVADLAKTSITITDFSVAEDVLNLSALGPQKVLTNTQLANIAAEADFDAALTLASSLAGGGNYVVFDYLDDAYVFHNAVGAAGTLSNGDGLLKVVGFSVEDITATNFVA